MELARTATIVVVADLMFGSRIRAAADAAGLSVTFPRSADALAEAASGARLVLLDLGTQWLDAPAAIRSLRAGADTGRVRIVAFGPHVEGEALVAAREAGADRVLARSAFVTQLPQILADAGTKE